MADKLSKNQRSQLMGRIKCKNTTPELVVRKALHGLGYRYRLHSNDLPGKPDIIFRSRKKAIFVNGCFWHMHRGCSAGHFPKSNQNYWQPKLIRNVDRDKTNHGKLREMGWGVLVVWECETKNFEPLIDKLVRFLDD